MEAKDVLRRQAIIDFFYANDNSLFVWFNRETGVYQISEGAEKDFDECLVQPSDISPNNAVGKYWDFVETLE